jgi:hypothetical protein
MFIIIRFIIFTNGYLSFPHAKSMNQKTKPSSSSQMGISSFLLAKSINLKTKPQEQQEQEQAAAAVAPLHEQESRDEKTGHKEL